jgi:superfamily II DNA or RNA helicase
MPQQRALDTLFDSRLQQGQLRPELTLQTWSRGEGLLGLKSFGKLGPRGDSVTVVHVVWTYRLVDGTNWSLAAPTSILNNRPQALLDVLTRQGCAVTLQRDLSAEADALDTVLGLGLRPVPEDAFQWRNPQGAPTAPNVWTLAQESHFCDFYADQVPRLRALGWHVVVKPGFVHLPEPVQAWNLAIEKLRLPAREGAWLLSLGIELNGEKLDLAPLLADLLHRDERWRNAQELAQIDDLAVIVLRAPGGQRIEAPAGPLKAIVGAMLDLLTDPRRVLAGKPGFRLSAWDVHRLVSLQAGLAAKIPGTATNIWQLQGTQDLLDYLQNLKASGPPPPVEAPAGLTVTLRPYQLQGLAWLQFLRTHNLAGILADDMGLGKTAQALAHILCEKAAGRLDLPCLVVLPTSLIFNWVCEIKRMAPGLRVLTLQGPARADDFARVPDHDVVLTTYPLLWRDHAELAAHPYHLLLLDEAQMVKNAAGQSAQALRGLTARHRLCLTGTPIENHLGELWAQFDFLMPDFLGNAASFARQWRKPIEENGETLRAQLLAQRVRPFILRRRKLDVLAELPPKTEILVRVPLLGQQRELYEGVRAAADLQVRRVLQRQNFQGAQITILDALLKLRQVCCDPFLLKGQRTPAGMERAKLDWLSDNLPVMVEEGRRVLIFSQFTEMLDLIAESLLFQNLSFLRLSGKTPTAQRGVVVKQFQEGRVPVFLISLKAGGVGLNLTAADTVIHMDPWWNPAVQAQATARAHRIGQLQAVSVYQLVVEGSIEERMLELQASKLLLTEGVLGFDAAGTVKFSDQDLKALLAPLN